jgi:hypothetical protein
MTPTKAKGMEELKDILPPFQSPWRSVNRSRTYWDTVTPRKSIGKGRISGHGVGPRVSGTGGKRPRSSKGRVGSSSSFIRTPLKSGKRLSSIIPPVSYAPLAFGQATPRVSLDDVYEEVSFFLGFLFLIWLADDDQGCRVFGEKRLDEDATAFFSFTKTTRFKE